MAEAKRLAKGDEIAGRYAILRELGRGGMAYVYLCDDRVSGEKVAAKVLFAEEGVSTQRHAVWFYQEARALAALDHPAIVRARDFAAGRAMFADGRAPTVERNERRPRWQPNASTP